MVTYGDYFSRKVLHNCGVSPNKAMFEKDEKAYTGTQRIGKIRSEMSEIYQTLYRGHTENNTLEANGQFADLQVERKIVAAFYDSGILSNSERDYFQTQSLYNLDEREKISVEEANAEPDAVKAQKVDAPMKILSARNVRQ